MTQEQFERASIINLNLKGLRAALNQMQSIRLGRLFNTNNCMVYTGDIDDLLEEIEKKHLDALQTDIECQIVLFESEFSAL